MPTRVTVLYGDREDRFNEPLFGRLEVYADKIFWKERPELKKKLFEPTGSGLPPLERMPELEEAVFAHVTNLQDVTEMTGSRGLVAAGKALAEAVEFQLLADHIGFHESQVGGEAIKVPFATTVQARVRIERSTTGEVFVFVVGAGGKVQAIRTTISYLLTDRLTMQVRPYYLHWDEVQGFWKYDRSQNRAGTVYIWKYEHGISLQTRDSKNSTRLSNWVRLLTGKFKTIEYPSSTLEEWVTLRADDCSLSWTKTDPDELIRMASHELVPWIIQKRGGVSAYKHSPFS